MSQLLEPPKLKQLERGGIGPPSSLSPAAAATTAAVPLSTTSEDEEDTSSSSEVVPVMASLGSSSSSFSSGGRALAELERRKLLAQETVEALQHQLEELEQGIDLGRSEVGGNGLSNYVPLTPLSEDERFFKQCQQDPLLVAYFGGDNSATGKGAGVATASTPAAGTNPDQTGAGAVEAEKPGRGVLSLVSERVPFMGWLSTSRVGVLTSAGVLLVLGLCCLIVLVSVLTRSTTQSDSNVEGLRSTPTVGAVELQPEVLTPTPNVALVQLQATVTAQASQLQATATALAARPTATAAPLPSATPVLPTTTPTPDLSQELHNGLLPPARLGASKLGFNNDKVRRFATTADGRTLVSGPPKGIIYHFGAYPGERPGNVVMIGDYETVGVWLELFQTNDLIEVTDRNGGVYTYRVLPFASLTRQAQSTPTASSGAGPTLTPTPTPTSSVSNDGEGQGGGVSNNAPSYPQATAAAALADQLELVTDWQDTSLVEKPVNPAVSILTLVSMGKTGGGGGGGADPPGRRYALRARFVSYAPASNLPPGTPVSGSATGPLTASGTGQSAAPGVVVGTASVGVGGGVVGTPTPNPNLTPTPAR